MMKKSVITAEFWKDWCEMAYPHFKQRGKSEMLGPFGGGVMLDCQENELPAGKSPEILNMIYENGVLRKREGLKALFENSGDEITAWLPESYYGYIIYACRGMVKAYSVEEERLVILKKDLPGENGCFFGYNGRVYYVGDGGYFRIEYTDEALSLKEVEGYIPTAYINCNADGIGDSDEEFNFLTGKYKASYNTVQGMGSIVLPAEKTRLSSGFTVEYNGKIMDEKYYEAEDEKTITFRNFEFSDGHNNLVVTACEENDEDRGKITGCKTAAFFGGSSSGLSEGTRVFLSGNEKYANTFFRSALKNPEYFPVSGFEILGDIYDPITCFGKLGGALIIFKKNSIYMSCYEYSSGEVVFTITNISPDRGCDRPSTLALVSNRLIWFHSRYGVMCLDSINPRGQNNPLIISGNINGGRGKAGLMQRDGEKVSAFIYKERYYVSTPEYCYMLDLDASSDMRNPRNLSWYLFSGFYGKGRVMHKSRTLIITGKEQFAEFGNILYDFNEDNPIKAVYSTPAWDFGSPFLFKTINRISIQMRADYNSYLKVKVFDEDGKLIPEKEYRLNKFTFVNFAFGKFTFKTRTYSHIVGFKTPSRRTKFLTIRFENSLPCSDMAISSVMVEYGIERGVKYNGI